MMLDKASSASLCKWISKINNQNNGYSILDSGGECVANTYHSFPRTLRDSERVGDLIASAPELLSTLEQILDAEFGFGTWPMQEEIKSLIDKAKGATK